MNKFIKNGILALSIIISVSQTAFCNEEIQPLKIQTERITANLDMTVKDNFIKAKYASAINRFAQSNVKAAYDDMNSIVQKTEHDDYYFLIYAQKMAEFGFFDLTEQVITRIDNNIYTESYIKDIKKYYYPSSLVKNKDYVAMSDAYSNIIHNNMAIETTSELLSSVTIEDSDYKNYLIALGYYKSNNLQKALKYINNAITENNVNVNYKVLKAKILADSNKNSQALKLLAAIKKENFKTVDFRKKIQTLEEYVLYKTSKNEILKDYHLSYYYHLQDKSLLATKVLQSSIIQAKQYSSQIFALLAKIYYENDESLKAQEFAQRSFKEDKNNYLANMTLANINYDSREYDKALNYYKKAKKLSNSNDAANGIAKTYFSMNNVKKSKKLYTNLLKKTSEKDILVDSLRVYPQRADEYLPDAISQDLTNNDIWLALAQQAINDNNLKLAITCLNNSYYIDSNNYKYYYYLSMVLRAKGDIDSAEQSLIKCSRLNSDYNAELETTNREFYEK